MVKTIMASEDARVKREESSLTIEDRLKAGPKRTKVTLINHDTGET